jgi:hypothetical protein
MSRRAPEFHKRYSDDRVIAVWYVENIIVITSRLITLFLNLFSELRVSLHFSTLPVARGFTLFILHIVLLWVVTSCNLVHESSYLPFRQRTQKLEAVCSAFVRTSDFAYLYRFLPRLVYHGRRVVVAGSLVLHTGYRRTTADTLHSAPGCADFWGRGHAFKMRPIDTWKHRCAFIGN